MVFRKKKKIDTLDNLHEVIKIAQKVYELKWDQKISVEKVRFLYDFLFDQITESLNKNVRFNIYNFGSFHRVYNKQRLSKDPLGEKCIITPYYTIKFKMGKGLKRDVNRCLTADTEPVEKKVY